MIQRFQATCAFATLVITAACGQSVKEEESDLAAQIDGLSENLSFTCPEDEPDLGTGSFTRDTAAHHLNIEFDYTYDNGYFSANPERKAALEASATYWGDLLADDFAAVPAGRSVSLSNSETGGTESLTLGGDLDDIRIWVFAFAFGADSSTLAYAGPFGSWYSGDAYDIRWNGAVFEPWFASLTVRTDPSVPWYFDTDPATVDDFNGDSSMDFFTTAMHELGHVLGFLSGPYSKTGNLTDGAFSGAKAIARTDGQHVTLDGSHLSSEFTTGLLRPGLESYMMYGSSHTKRLREYPSALELAMLEDLGYSPRYEALRRTWDDRQGDGTRAEATLAAIDAAAPALRPDSLWLLDDPVVPNLAVTGIPLKNITIGKSPAITMTPCATDTGGNSYFVAMPDQDANGGGEYVNQYSISFDLKLPAGHGRIPLFNTNRFGDNGAELAITATGALTTGDATSSYSMRPDLWYRVLLTADLAAGSVDVYVNGKAVAGTGGDVDGVFSAWGRDQSVPVLSLLKENGAAAGGVNLMNVAWWKRTLSTDEVAELSVPGTLWPPAFE